MLQLIEEEKEDDYGILLGMAAIEGERLAIESRGPRRRGIVPGHAVIDRDRVEGHNRLYQDYFAETPKYSLQKFRRRFRMRRPLFFRIQSAVENYDPYFVQRMDCSSSG